MLAVLEHGQRRLASIVEAGIIGAPTLEARLEQLLDILAEYDGAPEYLAYLQVTLDLGLAPDTTDDVRSIAKEMSTETIDAVVRLTRARSALPTPPSSPARSSSRYAASPSASSSPTSALTMPSRPPNRQSATVAACSSTRSHRISKRLRTNPLPTHSRGRQRS